MLKLMLIASLLIFGVIRLWYKNLKYITSERPRIARETIAQGWRMKAGFVRSRKKTVAYCVAVDGENTNQWLSNLQPMDNVSPIFKN
jgi:hypothetical protein